MGWVMAGLVALTVALVLSALAWAWTLLLEGEAERRPEMDPDWLRRYRAGEDD